jgi:hypothetical protein
MAFRNKYYCSFFFSEETSITMKLAYNGTTWDWIFSVTCRVFLIHVKQSRYRPGVAQRVPGS